MADSPDLSDFGPAVHAACGSPAATALVVCEHASNRFPEFLDGLGLGMAARNSHIAWDPGALGVATVLAGQLGAPLVYGGVSRLVYDCNRPPEAHDAIPARSEIHDVPGNAGLTDADRQARVAAVYEPFRAALAGKIAIRSDQLSLLVTVHSFTPVYMGRPRKVEIGILHGKDDRFARAMMAAAPKDLPHVLRLNEPYSAADGVAHTLDLHGAANGLHSVMIEIRNDLIASEAAQAAMAARLAPWISETHDILLHKGAA